MQSLSALSPATRQSIKAVLTDIDDTLTTDGRLRAAAYGALERLQDSGLIVIPITGRPAGWCDHIARMWPVDGVVGENGAFYFQYDRQGKVMIKRFQASDAERAANRGRLAELRESILRQVPGCAVASDQLYREADLAIDFCEDVPPLPEQDVERIVALFEGAGATAKVSSIHVNGWFGSYDKLSMTRLMLAECFGMDLDAEKDRIIFIGDSPNDAPMFEFFPHSVGVANVGDFTGRLAHEPAFVTESRASAGFCELAEALLEARAL